MTTRPAPSVLSRRIRWLAAAVLAAAVAAALALTRLVPAWTILAGIAGIALVVAIAALYRRLAAAHDAGRRAYADLDRANRELAELVRQRDVEVQQRTGELRRALDKANEAIRARDALLANTSHEIRTPLYGIIGGVELVRTRLSDAEDLRHLDAVAQSAESLMQIINDLLDFSRINAGLVDLAARPFSLSDVAAQAVASIAPLAAHKGLKVRVDDRLRAPVRAGDALRVRQILMNLVGNAVKFTERGSVTVELDEPDGGTVRIAVHDTGVGIAPGNIDRIFRPFEQVDVSSRRRFQGTGLGLAIVDRLVDAMGGAIAVSSALGKGSTFALDLPLPVASAHVITVDAPVPSPVANYAGMRVLVVDDVELNRMLLGAQLKRAGIDALFADDGYAALTHVAREVVDLVLLDVQMPGIDGLETAERLRALPHGRGVRIVAVTANAQPGEREACLAAGIDDYVTKPLRAATLGRLLADATAFAPSDAQRQAGLS